MVNRLKPIVFAFVATAAISANAMSLNPSKSAQQDADTVMSCSTSIGFVGLVAILAIGAAGLVSFRVVRLNNLLSVEIEQRQRLYTELENIARNDHLTGLPNRRTFFEALDREVQRSNRHRRDTCIAMIDVDFFKRVNDRFGHARGDEALALVAQAIKNTLREHDTAGRLGGEEFAVCLPETTADQATSVAERIRVVIQNTPLTFGEETFTITVSIGVAHMETGETKDQLLSRADAALFNSKREGRNRISVATPNLS